MIKVFCKNENFRYNAYHLTKAFWPEQQVDSFIEPEQAELALIIGSEDFDLCPEKSGVKILAAVGTVENKDVAERELYRQLSLTSGKQLPWGVLTGIRPTKLASRALDKMDRESFISWIGSERLVSSEKAGMAWDIAAKEKKIIDSSGKGWSLYVNVPICPTRCSYCSFNLGILKDWEGKLDAYVDALVNELGQVAAKENGMPTTIYIGGGTPTVLSVGQLKKLLNGINKCFSDYGEFTLEAGRPDTINEEKLSAALDLGVNRISINPQTMQQRTLDLVGRGHSPQDIKEKFNMAHRLGFNNINMDLIAGLPGETAADMEDTLRQVTQLGPDSLTIHALAIKRRAEDKLKGQMPEDAEKMRSYVDNVTEMINLGEAYAKKMGLCPYYLYRQKSIAGNFENVGYAKPGKEGIFNILTMEEAQSIIGVGAGAASKHMLDEPVEDPKRGPGHMTNVLHYVNTKDIGQYIKFFVEKCDI